MTSEEIKVKQQDVLNAARAALEFFVSTNEMSQEKNDNKKSISDIMIEEIKTPSKENNELWEVSISYKKNLTNDKDDVMSNFYKNQRFYKIFKLDKEYNIKSVSND